jgi:DNA-directed RNA polymerase II subunit RPB4
MVATLCPGDADEAKTLIPSIMDKISDVELQELLDEINEKRRMFVD